MGTALSTRHHTNGREPSLGAGPLRLRHPVLAAAIALLVGTLAAAAGAGLAIRFAQKTGLSATTVVGAVLLAIGLLLLGYAAAVAWRLLHGWWRLLLAPAAVIVLLLGASAALAVSLAVVPPMALGAGTPAAEGLPYRDVAFRTADGARLSAWLVPSRNGAAVVVRHGAGSTRTGALHQAGVLGRHGYGVLLVDARGHGRSGGDGDDLGWYGDADVTAAVSYLARQPGVDPGRIGVLGLSMGGEEGIGAAAADPRVRAVVAEGATARTAADKDLWLPGGVTGAVQRVLDRVTYGLVDVLTPTGPPTTLRDAVANAPDARFLLVTAGEMPDEQSAAQVLRAAAPARVAVWQVPGADHTQGLAVAPRQWRARVLDFLDATLHPRTEQ